MVIKSFNIEGDLAAWLDEKKDAGEITKYSDFINELLRKEIDKHIDPWEKLQSQKEILEKATKKYDELLDVVTKLKFDGNLREREEARITAEKIRSQEEEKLRKLVEKRRMVEQTSLWEEFVNEHPSPDDNLTLRDFAVRFQEEGFKIGGGDLRRMLVAGVVTSSPIMLTHESRNGGGVEE